MSGWRRWRTRAISFRSRGRWPHGWSTWPTFRSIAGLYAYRRRCGLLAPREPALVAGCLTLVVIFLSTLPFNAARVAFAIQLQPARVFWMLDLLAVIYVVWVAAEGGAAPCRRRGARQSPR